MDIPARKHSTAMHENTVLVLVEKDY